MSGSIRGLRRGRSGLMATERHSALNPLSLAGLAIVACFAAVALAAPIISPYQPAAIDPAHRLESPSIAHPLGTDNLGRDLFSRIAYGSRWSLGAAATAAAIIVVVGVVIGIIAGYKRNRATELLMRFVDVVLAFPTLLLALAIAGTLGPGIDSVVIGLAAVGWAAYARIVRGIVLEIREREFVLAARALGARDSWVVIRHIVPNVMPVVVVLATVEIGELILAIAGFGFLGLGAQSPTPEWGAMINDARPYMMDAPLLVIVPGIAIGGVVAGFTLLGDGLRDRFDPRLSPLSTSKRPRG